MAFRPNQDLARNIEGPIYVCHFYCDFIFAERRPQKEHFAKIENICIFSSSSNTVPAKKIFTFVRQKKLYKKNRHKFFTYCSRQKHCFRQTLTATSYASLWLYFIA